MKDIIASYYSLMYANSNIVHTVSYQGKIVTAFSTAGNYFRITFYDGSQKNIKPADTLQVKVTNKFYV